MARATWGATVAVMGAAGTAAGTPPTGAGAAPAPAPPPVQIPGVTITPDGWIHYQPLPDATAPSLRARTALAGGAGGGAPVDDAVGQTMVDPTSQLVQGTFDPDGDCVLTQSETLHTSLTGGSPPVFSEETAYNPTTCQAVYLTGSLPAAAGSAVAPATPRMAGVRAVGARDAASSTIQKNAYVKDAYLDPVDITINSLATNLGWSISNPASCVETPFQPYVSAYEFAWDGWSTPGFTEDGPWKSKGNCTSVSLGAVDTFTNSDFEALLVALLGPSAIAACGFDVTPAFYSYSEILTGYDDGSVTTTTSDQDSGGCTDLTHRDSESGYQSPGTVTT